MEENIKEYGNMMLQDEKGHKIQMISIIGEIEGHESLRIQQRQRNMNICFRC
ncbi:hypothetical protein [Roseburia sp. AM59-24XD]|uniref:hypothetical protein n=1 Tax=Roseburia sp. AM59-24XD TaxID=2293138 RepID=UPI002687ADE8|nr:hypothetical protein [Roseburia sp. AM59-24XD]